MRQLASVKRVGDIFPIESRDRIELAMIDGWSVIVKKDEFKTGDLCVYCEIDSVLPEKPEFEFLRSKNFRIKTMRMAGVLSQGICFPMDILPEGKYAEGQDVTEIIGVTQYEATMDKDPEQNAKNAKKPKYPKWLMRWKWFRALVKKKDGSKESRGFPNFISKTDETRIQNAPFYLGMNERWVLTEKIDGQSGTFAMVKHKRLFGTKYEFIVCSRNLRLFADNGSNYWKVAHRYNLEVVLREMLDKSGGQWVAVQGEIIAPNVQKNKYKVTEPDLYVFNLIYPTGRTGSADGKRAVAQYGLKWVPIVSDGALLPKTVPEMLDFAHGDSALGHTIREGLVCRTVDGKHSFKAVDPLFLIKYDA